MTNEDGKIFDFRIGVIGPTRVGKTSLLASLLDESQRLLEGTPVSMMPIGATRKRLSQHQTEIKGSLLAGEFNPGGLKGTQDKFTFELEMRVGQSAIRLGFLDYPGEWFDPTRRPEKMEAAWRECEHWITDSSVLLLPVDAAVVMEAMLPRHKGALPGILRIHDVEQVVRQWSKGRKLRPEEPALLILAPLKCESYFADNGGRKDRSQDLFGRIQQRELYGESIEIVKRECHKARILYCPVDTFGCVEIMRADWNADPSAPGGLSFSADYLVRPPGHLMQRGAGNILQALCQHLVQARADSQRQAATQATLQARFREAEAQRSRGFFGEMLAFFTGEKRLLRREALQLRDTAWTHEQAVAELSDAVETLGAREMGPRVRIL